MPQPKPEYIHTKDEVSEFRTAGQPRQALWLPPQQFHLLYLAPYSKRMTDLSIEVVARLLSLNPHMYRIYFAGTLRA